MKGGRWVKCVKTITEIFIEGKYYQINYQYDTYITLIDELGNGLGFDTSRDQVFKDHFKLGISQKRGTKWDISRRQ
jgi:hypothetical protein